MVNVLMLTGSIYMLQVYDRVLPSRSVPTLIALTVALLGLYALLGLFDWARQHILARVGTALDEALSAPVVGAILRLANRGRESVGTQPSRDLDAVRGFLSSLGPTALFDLPWVPLYLVISFMLHPLIGWTVVIGALILASLTIVTELRVRAPAKEATLAGAQRAAELESARRNAEIISALGIENRIAERFRKSSADFIKAQQGMSDVTLSLGTLSKIVRFVLQSATLGVGAWLVIHGEASGGVMIASSIMSSRALAPIELAIGNWKPFLGARDAWKRLHQTLSAAARTEPTIVPQTPRNEISVDGIVVVPPGAGAAAINNVSFKLKAGDGLGIIGPSASGKSSLARALVGVWQAQRGEIRLDGATYDQWPDEIRGAMIGYLPQDIELFGGTVADNISRFDPQANSASVQAAAETAGAHEMILRLPAGYETRIGESGSALSGGQRQRIALARALYGNPFLVVLDEPNSNLDSDGEAALAKAIASLRARGAIAIIIAHRRAALDPVDLVLALNSGVVQGFGPKDETLRNLFAPSGPTPLARPRVATAKSV
ncbi:type I secretion protein [Terrihabitans soli]|uniref:Type I secretion protein n=2 Tax=Terrihabitans soli TaxID=708113 RepID=A0A6S6QQR6_9HYPH|nr:type I secretion protein [Terrihabitans soli]